MQGQKLFRQKDINGARAAYEEAITHAHRVPVEDTLTVEYRTLTTSIYISYANAHEENDEERIRHCGTAYAQIISLETAIRRSPSENAYQTLLSLCNHLMKLVPKKHESSFRSIPSIVKECQSKIEELQKPTPLTQGPSKSGKGPRRPHRSLTILVALAFAGLVVFAGAWLYRRLITKIE